MPAPEGLYRQVPATEVVFEVRELGRLPLGTSYPVVASRVCGLVLKLRERERQAWLIVDATGVGLPVVDLLREALRETRHRLTAVTFTHGYRCDDDLVHRKTALVGKAWLVSRLQALLQGGRLALPARKTECEALARELLDYEIRVDQDANDRFGAFKVGSHDDLVTALGLAVLDDPRPGPRASWLG